MALFPKDVIQLLKLKEGFFLQIKFTSFGKSAIVVHVFWTSFRKTQVKLNIRLAIMASMLLSMKMATVMVMVVVRVSAQLIKITLFAVYLVPLNFLSFLRVFCQVHTHTFT